jgi:hypothetical protein
MGLAKFKPIVVVTMAVAGLAASLVVQHRAEARIRGNDEVLAEQANQLAQLAAEHERLSNRVVELQSSPAGGQVSELERLRVEADRLREQAKEIQRNLQQSSGTRKLLGVRSVPPGYKYSQEYFSKRQEVVAGKEKDASALSDAFYRYYTSHEDRFPSGLNELDPDHLSLTGTNEFELLYPATPAALTNFPTQMVAVFRERQPWLAPSGKWARVYGGLTFPPRTVETDDNFQSWEAEHIIPPPSAGQR